MKANWKGIELDARAKKPLSMQEAMGEVLKAREAEKEECRAGRGESAANGIVFVGNFSGKPVTVGVESVAADKARVLLANGAVIFGASFRLAPWGFAFLEEK